MCSVGVSTEDQAREGFSLPEQKERLEKLNKIAIKQLSILYNDNNIFKIEQLDKRLIDLK